MALRAWYVEALSGDVITEARLGDGSSFTSKLWGGTLNATVPLGLYRRSNGQPDTTAIQSILDLCDGGRHTLLLTDGTETLGEWIIWKHSQPAPDGSITVSGFEWDGYPAFRSLHTSYKYKNGNLGTVTRRLLFDAYNMYQRADAEPVVVPTPSTSQTVTMDHPIRTGYYGDVLEDLDDMEPGLEWRVVPTSTWSGGMPTHVTRTVTYGSGKIRRSTDLKLVKPPDDRRGGNVTSFERSRDFSKVALSLYGWGAGKGGKQRYYGDGDTTMLRQGYLQITKNISWPGEYSNDALVAKVRKAVAAAQEAWEPSSATVNLDMLGGQPRIGDLVDAEIGWSWSMPSGYTGRMRVGQVTYRIGTPLIDLELEED